MKILLLSLKQLGYIRYGWNMKENILNFALSPLSLVYIEFLMPTVIQLGCKCYIGWKQ